MADVSVARKPSGQHTWIWAVLAVIAVAALMVWLAIRSAEISEVAEVAEEAAVEEAEAPAAAAEVVELPAIAADPAAFSDRAISLTDVNVAATLGPRAFWAEVPGANPFLVVLAPTATGADLVAQGNTVAVEGAVSAVADTTVAEWVETGAIGEGAREEAAFATHYLAVSEVRQ